MLDIRGRTVRNQRYRRAGIRSTSRSLRFVLQALHRAGYVASFIVDPTR